MSNQTHEDGLPPVAVFTEQLIARRSKFTPEQSLCEAMLMDAVKILRSEVTHTQYLREVAEEWVRGDAVDWPYFSFEAVCQYLYLDPDAVRVELLRAA